ncbi:MAG: molecular chaperone [Candidatus Eremiobacteraeota bacterium]|nr:molecular chaperone [Candidatus Eremiobacteraeota bacterium]
MGSRSGRRTSALLLGYIVALGFAFGKAESASAANIAISPVNIDLARAGQSALLTLTNVGGTTVTYSLGAYAWDQGESGVMQLAKTADIIFFPEMLQLGPGERRNVRIGTELAPGAVEKTYRLVLDELPAPQTSQRGPEVRVLTRITIPVFLAPVLSHAQADVNEVAVHKGAMAFRITNAGNVHVQPRLTVTAHDANHHVIYDLGPQTIWYILASGFRDVKVTLPTKTCASVRSLLLSVEMDTLVIKREVATPLGACPS